MSQERSIYVDHAGRPGQNPNETAAQYSERLNVEKAAQRVFEKAFQMKHMVDRTAEMIAAWEVMRWHTDPGGRQRADMFLHLPERQMYPEYYAMITHPTALMPVKASVLKGVYTTWAQFHTDVVRIFSNARQFNDPGLLVYTDANALEQVFLQHVNDAAIAAARAAEEAARAAKAEAAAREAEAEAAAKAAEDEARRLKAASKTMAAPPAKRKSAAARPTDLKKEMLSALMAIVNHQDAEGTRYHSSMFLVRIGSFSAFQQCIYSHSQLTLCTAYGCVQLTYVVLRCCPTDIA